MEIGILTAFFAGIVSFLSPCVLPLAPPYLAYLGGTTLDQISGEDRPIDRQVSRRVFVSAIFFVMGLATVFVLLGMGASAFGQILRENKHILGQISGGIIVVLGLHFLSILRIPLLNREARFEGPQQAGSWGASYVIGIAFAFGWTPCIGPILGAILSMAAQEETISAGTALLGVYAFGLGMPFLIAALFVGPFLQWAKNFRRHMPLVEKVMGLMLITVGIMMITGDFERLAYFLLETFPSLAEFG
ncbi:MAG: cytochrome c biogenesis CcdA family protein [Pseudomonadota bacterium]